MNNDNETHKEPVKSKVIKRDNSNQKIPSVYPKGIFLLPSVLTGTNIILGFYSIILVTSWHGELLPVRIAEKAALLIILASVFDAIDGRIARLTRTTSPFGAQLDSIADVVSFGLAPSILAYHWALSSFTRFGWIAALLFLLAGAVRLARFNVLEEQYSIESKQFFIGLPIPAAAISICLAVRIIPDIQSSLFLRFLMLIMVYLLALLMVSGCRFKSFKDIDWKKRRPIGAFFIILVALLVILHDPFIFLSILMALYILSGIMMKISPAWVRRGFHKLGLVFTRFKVLDDDQDNDASECEEPEAEPDEEAEPDDESGECEELKENS